MNQQTELKSAKPRLIPKKKYLNPRDLQLFGLKSPVKLPMEKVQKLLNLIGGTIGKLMSVGLGYGWPKGGPIRLKEYWVTLPDGAKLATDIFLPKSAWKSRGKVPTILIRMPYWKDIMSMIGYFFALHGYACVMQDIRGCAHSNMFGTNGLNLSDREDGLVTLKWVCNQFWYNGKIGMWGASYIGLTQWAIAFDNDGMLQCINPSLTTYHNLWNFRGGLIINELNASIAAILLNTCGQYTVNPDFNAIDKIQFCKRMVTDPTYQMFNEPMESLRYQKVPRLRDFKGMTLGEKEMYLLERTGMILDFANHEFDTFYKLVYRILKKYNINTVAKYMPGNLDMDSAAQINTPIYMVGGWMDLFCEHLLKDYMEIAETAPLELKQNIKMIMGPWAHGAFPFPGVPYYKMLDFARAILPIPYYDYILKDKDTAWKNQAPVRIYVMGRNVWRDEQEWPLSRAIPQKWFLHSGGQANTRSGNGKLSIIEPDDEPADEFEFDPLDPVMTVGGRNLFIQKRSRSQHHPEMRKDVLVYTSDPLPRGVEVTGKVVMTLYASSSAIDTDFMAKLCDVDLKGKSINVLDMGVRARFRTGHPQPLVPGEIFPFEIELGHTSMYFAKGHRIRLDITSSNFPRFDVNSNLGGEQNEKGYAVAHQQVHHTTSYASELVLPVIPD